MHKAPTAQKFKHQDIKQKQPPQKYRLGTISNTKLLAGHRLVLDMDLRCGLRLYLVLSFERFCITIKFRYFCGGSFCFMSWCLKYFCAVGALCMFAYF